MTLSSRLRKARELPKPPPASEMPRGRLFRKLQERGMRSEVLEWKRTPTESEWLRFRVLSFAEFEECRLKARERLKNREASEDIIADAVCIEVLFRSICEVEERRKADGTVYYQPEFSHPNDLRELLEADEIAQLYNLWDLVQNSGGPSDWAFHVEDNLNEWVKALAEGIEDPANFLAHIPSRHWAEILIAMARALHNFISIPSENSPNIGESPDANSQSIISSSTEPVSTTSANKYQNTPHQTYQKAKQKRKGK